MKPAILRLSMSRHWVAVMVLSLSAPGVAIAQQEAGKAKKTPLDELKAADIPAAERFAWQPKNLVAVYGSHAWHYWPWTTYYSSVSHLTTDGKRVTVGSWNTVHGGPDGSLRVFDAATSKDIAVFKLPKDRPAKGAGFSAGGKLVALCQENQFDWEATVWDVASKKVLFRPSGKGASPSRLHFSPNGKLLAYYAAGIQFFDLASGKHLATTPQVYSGAPLFHPSSTRVYYYVLGTDPEKSPPHHTIVYEFDLVKRKERLLLNRPGYSVYGDGGAFALAVAPDGRWLAAAFYPDDPKANSYVQLWNVIEDKPGAKIDCSRFYATSMAFSPDNKSLAIAVGPGRIQMHERGTGKLIRTLETPVPQYVPYLLNLAYSPDGKFLTAASPSAARIILWDVTSEKPVHEPTAFARILAVSPDSRQLLIDAGPDSQQQLFDPRGLALVDVETGRRVPIEPIKGQGAVERGVFSPDGRSVALVQWWPGARMVRLIDAQTGKDALPADQRIATSGEHWLAFFLPDGKRLVTAGGRTCNISELATRKVETHTYAWTFLNAVLSHDGKTLIADTNENIKVVDLATFEVIKSLDREGRPGLVAISRNGEKVAHVSEYSTAVQVLNMKDGETLYDLKGHIQPITAVCFDRKSEDLFTAGYDGRIIRWLSATSKQEWRVPGPVRSMQLSPEGRHLLVSNANGTAYVLRVEEVE